MLSGQKNHRMAEVGKDLQRSPSPTPAPLMQSHLQPVDHNCIQMALNIPKDRVRNLPGQPHSKEVFYNAQKEPPVFHFVPTAFLVMPLSTTEKSPATHT